MCECVCVCECVNIPTYMGAYTSQKRDLRFSEDGATSWCQSPEMGAKNRILVLCRSSRYFNNRVIAPEAAYFFWVSKFYFSHEYTEFRN